MVPVILEVHAERGVPVFFQGVRTSCLVRLTVEAHLLYRRARGAELTLQGSAGPETVAAFEDALAALARIPRDGSPALGHYWFRAHWDMPGARLTGRSATLAFLLAAQSAHATHSLVLGHRSLSGGVAVTGDLRDGRIVPVDSLDLKVQACFAGPVRILVVPAEQREEALQSVRRLEQQHPGRQLLVLGARRAADLWDEPAVVNVRTRPMGQVARALFRRVAVSRAFVGVLVGLFVLLTGLAARGLWLSRPWPVDARWESQDLVLRNASGRAYHRLHLPPGTPGNEVQNFELRAGKIATALDVDGRFPNEVTAIRWRPGFDGNDLCAWNGRGRPRWSLSSAGGLEGSAFAGEQLHWRFFCPVGTSESGALRFLAVRRSVLGSLSLVDLIDASDATRMGLLVNQGHLRLIFTADVDLDRKQELFLAGTDNEEDKGLVVLVDPDSMPAPPSPSREESWTWMARPEALGRGVRAALRFPKDDLLPAGRPDCIEGRMESGLFLVVTQTTILEREILFYLDLSDVRRPQVVRAALIDAYRIKLATLAPGLTAADLSREQGRLSRRLTYLTPEGWRPIPVRESTERNVSVEGGGRD
jgi:hypothetical protein